MNLKTIKELDITGKRVFIRCDFNVPTDDDGNITDDRRIYSTLPTIKYCLDHDCKVILASHFGRPKGEGFDAKYSLLPVAKRLHTLLKKDITLAKDTCGDDAVARVESMNDGDIVLLENLRFEAGETKNNAELAKKLASLADVYINDAFGASHRAHASVEAMATLFDDNARGAGFLLAKEVKYLHGTMASPARPFVAIVGGSKVSGKLEALSNLITNVDKLIIGGGMAFTFLKALGYGIGNSLCEDDLIDDAKAIMKKAQELGVKLYLPVDVTIADKFAADAKVSHSTAQEIPEGWMGLDIGHATSELFMLALKDANTVLWNGPMGVYEMDKFSKGSFKLSHFLTRMHATTIIGGGDTADMVQRAGDTEGMTFISTGGGASLELLEGKELPGIKALRIE